MSSTEPHLGGMGSTTMEPGTVDSSREIKRGAGLVALVVAASRSVPEPALSTRALKLPMGLRPGGMGAVDVACAHPGALKGAHVGGRLGVLHAWRAVAW
jgi:hypothetical protein